MAILTKTQWGGGIGTQDNGVELRNQKQSYTYMHT